MNFLEFIPSLEEDNEEDDNGWVRIAVNIPEEINIEKHRKITNRDDIYYINEELKNKTLNHLDFLFVNYKWL